jgi:hypothetical protein
MTDQAPPDRDPWTEFARLLLGDGYVPPPGTDPTPDEGLDPADEFGLAVLLAMGERMGVPPDYDPDSPAELDLDAPRAPRPDKSQGRRTTPAPDPATAFGAAIIDAINDPRGRWRGI